MPRTACGGRAVAERGNGAVTGYRFRQRARAGGPDLAAAGAPGEQPLAWQGTTGTRSARKSRMACPSFLRCPS
jgi:hypothetical protein